MHAELVTLQNFFNNVLLYKSKDDTFQCYQENEKNKYYLLLIIESLSKHKKNTEDFVV